MRRHKQLGLALMAMLAISAITATTASAEATLPNILPLPTATEPVSGTSTASGSSKFGNGLVAITATGSSGTQASEGLTGKLGIFQTTFVGATSALGKCTTTGKSAGEILVEGVYHVRDYKNRAGKLKTAIAFLLIPVNFVCGGVPTEWNGCLAGSLAKESEATSLLTATFAVSGLDNEIITILNEANTLEEACQLLARVNGAATELASLETIQLLTGFKQGAATTTLEVMPLTGVEALPNLLPLPTAGEPVTGTSSTSNASKFANGLVAITATGSSGSQSSEDTEGKAGSFQTTFTGSTSALGKCTTAGKAAGDIRVEGEYLVRDYKNAAKALRTAILFLLTPVNFVCGTVPVEVNGCVAGALTNESEAVSSLTATLKVASGDNEIITVLNEGNTAEEACQLLARVNGAATELSSEETSQLFTGFKRTGVATTVEVMPL